MKHLAALALAGTFAALSGTAQAAFVSSFGSPAAGWSVGSGQPAGGFNLRTDTESGVQLGLRSQDYQIGVSSNNGAGGDYFVKAGERAPGLALWNIDFTIDGVGELIQNLGIMLEIDWDPGVGVDKVVYNLSNAVIGSGLTVLQGSQNLGFSFWSHPFDPNAIGTYTFKLTQNETGMSQTIRVNVANAVPEPATLALAALALTGLGLARRRHR